MADGEDVLFDVKNFYHIGAYAQAISAASKVKVGTEESLRLERDQFVYRSYLAQKKYGVIFDEIKESAPPSLRCLRVLAKYLKDGGKMEDIEAATKDLFSSENTVMPSLAVGTIYFLEGDAENCLRTLSASSEENLEVSAMSVQCYLSIHRLDMAKKELKRMQEMDEDATLTQLASAWCCLAMGGEKLQDAYYTFQEMADKFKETALLLNGMASAYIGQNKWEEAEEVMQRAVSLGENDADTLINAITINRIMGKPEAARRHLTEIKSNFPDHPWVTDFISKDKLFDELAAAHAIPTN